MRGRKFFSSQGSGFHLPYFLSFPQSSGFLDSGFVLLPGGFFPGGVLFSLPELPPILGGILSDGGGSGIKEPYFLVFLLPARELGLFTRYLSDVI